MGEVLQFESRTCRITIDYNKCDGCDTFDCVKACRLYGRNVLRIEGKRPVLAMSPEEAKDRCIECLACEINCMLRAKGAITIEAPIPGLDEYRRRWA